MSRGGPGAIVGRLTVLIIAHRGASAEAPENTLAAFDRAVALGAGMIECDVHQSRDGQPVILHDFTLRRTAGLRRHVRSLTLAELRQCDVGRWFHPRYAGERIPTLTELLAHLKGRVQINLEIKRGSPYYPQIEERVVRAIEAAGAAAATLISSFDGAAMSRVRAASRRVRLGVLVTRGGLGAIRQAVALKAVTLHVSARGITPRLLAQAHAAGLLVYAYTVDRELEMRRLVLMGADGLFTNHPERLAGVLADLRSKIPLASGKRPLVQ